ncbi:MAG TPA: hypothetical protein VH436_35520 [Vicinamibacterales bacterium]|jgi:hypothetical protein
MRKLVSSGSPYFRDIRPVNTIMQVVRFIDPDWLVEIEADAVVDDVVDEEGGSAANG